MKIYLLDINPKMTEAWSKIFKDEPDVEIVNEDFKFFMDNHPEVDGIVSPANSFGLMDGGYDRAITEYFGKELMKAVQLKIFYEWKGEQPVGTCMSVAILEKMMWKGVRKTCAFLLHAPTMTAPEAILDTRVIYHCMRTTLLEEKRLNLDYVVIPAFGGATGQVDFDTIAKMMWLGYKQITNPLDSPDKINWKYALETQQKLLTAMV